MRTFTVNLNSVDKIRQFVNDINKVPFDVLMNNGFYTIDAKSIMGIFSLDFSKPIKVFPTPESADYPDADKLLYEAVKNYIEE